MFSAFVAAALATVLGASGCTHAPTAATTTAASPTAAANPTVAPATAVPRRITGPRSVEVPPPVTTPRQTRLAQPQILSASVSPTVVRSGTVVRATVRTTRGVVAVVAHVGGVSIPVPQIGPGLFGGSTTIPPLPPLVHGNYPVTFVARDARGAATQSAVGVSVR